jgi:hypothetical protein
MPVHKQGRYVEKTREELNAWLGKESGKTLVSIQRKHTFDFCQGPSQKFPAMSRVDYFEG